MTQGYGPQNGQNGQWGADGDQGQWGQNSPQGQRAGSAVAVGATLSRASRPAVG
ncbi:hypothetical protein [Brachybacterium sp. GPGPB12]|uniref:hypothetical protein n=1 Tax=Brachybacterium sp. GPGPB12 TaxID=3023517 RepID=UPI0031346028